jgi:hypothetical protein
MKRIQSFRFLLALVAGLMLAACANLQEPAQKFLADAESTISATSADAQQYVPDQYAAVSKKLADMKASFDKKDYKVVVEGGPALVADAKGLADAAAAKKREVLEALNAQWTSFATSVPQAIAAVEARLTTLAKAHKLPAGVTKDAVTASKAGLADAKTSWAEATSAFGSGNLQSAIEKAKAVKAKLDDVSAKLGIGGAKPAG